MIVIQIIETGLHTERSLAEYKLSGFAAMGWLWGSSTRTGDDPLKDLDPSLREFLAKESPVKYRPVAPPPEQQPSKPPASVSPEVQSSSEEAGQKVPIQSQYQDGRYAHLWKTYRPLQDVEDEIKTDQEKLLDVLQGYKNRKGMIGRAALENCALEQSDVQECWENGGMRDRILMCRTQEKSFNRCYVMQSVRPIVPLSDLMAPFLEILGNAQKARILELTSFT